MAVNTAKRLGRFADFELDLRGGGLRKDAAKPVRLPEQPFLILTMLLEHAGEVVSHEEIRKRLWPNDTIVEFEHCLSAAMNRLRQALGDSADNPRYIETLARRGYALLVPVDGRPDRGSDAENDDEASGYQAGLVVPIAALVLPSALRGMGGACQPTNPYRAGACPEHKEREA